MTGLRQSAGVIALALAICASQTSAMAGQDVVIRTAGGAGMPELGEVMLGGGPSEPMDTGTGVILGRVVEADGRTPVAGTIVTLSLGRSTPLRALTNSEGRFAFRGLPTGSFAVQATRPGFVDGAAGRLLAQVNGGTCSLLKPDGTPWQEGELIQQPDLARSLRGIAGDGIDYFYRGPIAQQVGQWMADHGGGTVVNVISVGAFRPGPTIGLYCSSKAALFALTAVAEIVGCYLPWLVIKQGKPAWLLLPATAALAAFVWLLALHPSAAGRTYAAYGGMYVAIALLWLWVIDGIVPSRWDLAGATVALIGMAIIALQPPSA